MSLRARPPAQNLDEAQVRSMRVWSHLRYGLITREECHAAISVIEHRYGVR